MSQAGIQRGPLQQTTASPNPGAELLLAVPPGTVCPTPKPSSPNSPATGSQPESVQRSGIHGRGHPWDTSTHSQRPPNISAVASEQEHTPSPHQHRRPRCISLRAAVQTCTASQRPVQPRPQCYKRRSWRFNTKGSSPPAGHLLSPQHHSHIQVGHTVPSFLHSIGQHRAGAARQSLCGHRLSWNRCDRHQYWHQQHIFLGLVFPPPLGALAHQRRRRTGPTSPCPRSTGTCVCPTSVLHPGRHLIQSQQTWLVVCL